MKRSKSRFIIELATKNLTLFYGVRFLFINFQFKTVIERL